MYLLLQLQHPAVFTIYLSVYSNPSDTVKLVCSLGGRFIRYPKVKTNAVQ